MDWIKKCRSARTSPPCLGLERHQDWKIFFDFAILSNHPENALRNPSGARAWPYARSVAAEMEGKAMMWVGIAAAAALIVVVLLDAFEVVLLPRRVRHGYRLARQFYRTSWMIGRTAARVFPAGPWRTGFLSAFGPLSLFVLVVVWATGLITGFALLHLSLGTVTSVADAGLGDLLVL